MGFLLNTSALCGIFACEVTQYGVQFILTLMSYTNGLMNSLVVILSEAKNPPHFGEILRSRRASAGAAGRSE
jgi:hypothetical protein